MVAYPRATKYSNSMIHSEMSCNTETGFLLWFRLRSAELRSFRDSLPPPPAPASSWFSLVVVVGGCLTGRRSRGRFQHQRMQAGGAGSGRGPLTFSYELGVARPSRKRPVVSGLHPRDQSASHPSEELPRCLSESQPRQRVIPDSHQGHIHTTHTRAHRTHKKRNKFDSPKL